MQSSRELKKPGDSGSRRGSQAGRWTGVFLLAALSLAGLLSQGRAAEALDHERAQDRLWLRQGDPVIGRLVNPHLEIQTPYARLQIPAGMISEARFGEGSLQLDRLTTRAGDRLSGFILDAELGLDPQSGPRLTARRDQVSRLALERANGASELDEERSGSIVFFRNGDLVFGRVVGGPFRLSTPQTDVMLGMEQLVSVVFSDTHPVLAEVRTGQNEKLEGVWPDREIEIALEAGPVLRVYPTRISSIDMRPASRAMDPGLAPSSKEADWGDGTRAPTDELDLVWIPAGSFVMGSSTEESDRDLDEGPLTRVQITHGFWIGRCEVTQALYREVMGTNPSLFVGDLRRPVERVRYRDALEFCAQLTRQHQAEGRLPADHVYRLPTEAEWEYACRAGTETRFCFGEDPRGYELEGYAWFNANSDSSTQPVGTRKQNAWGLHDMHGNVLEWCMGGASSTLRGGEVRDPLTPAEGLLRIARGGSWLYGAKACRSANRDSYGESTRSSDLGFRIVLGVGP